MDIILDLCDHHLLSPYVYPESWSPSSPTRQFLSLLAITIASGYVLYFATAGLNYWLIFDKKLLKHPLILKNQIRKEIWVTCSSVPFMGILSVFCFLLEVRGYSKLHSSVSWVHIPISLFTFILFTDCLIYWIHRTLHHPVLYKRLHKTHHRWKVPTPFASHAFHPIDGFLQSLPYHLYVFLFPMHKLAYLGMFLFVNVWTVSIHDGEFRVPTFLRSVVNGAAHHTDHHLLYNYNYGQFFTLWDRIGGSFKCPGVYGSDNKSD